MLQELKLLTEKKNRNLKENLETSNGSGSSNSVQLQRNPSSGSRTEMETPPGKLSESMADFRKEHY